MALPLATTKVSARVSIAEILDRLERIGFDEIGQAKRAGKNAVYGRWQGVTFQWSVDIQRVIDAMIKDLSERSQAKIRRKDPWGRQKLARIQTAAERIAWRVLADQINATCIAIQYKILEVGEAFGGFLSFTTKDGAKVTLGTYLVEQAAAGRLNSPNFMSPALIEEKK